jgi:imidazolonepropionase-like amidohydrolase
VRMASLTPARIAGWDAEVGSIEGGKRADLVWLDQELNVRGVWLVGRRYPSETSSADGSTGGSLSSLMSGDEES